MSTTLRRVKLRRNIFKDPTHPGGHRIKIMIGLVIQVNITRYILGNGIVFHPHIPKL